MWSLVDFKLVYCIIFVMKFQDKKSTMNVLLQPDWIRNGCTKYSIVTRWIVNPWMISLSLCCKVFILFWTPAMLLQNAAAPLSTSPLSWHHLHNSLNYWYLEYFALTSFCCSHIWYQHWWQNWGTLVFSLLVLDKINDLFLYKCQDCQELEVVVSHLSKTHFLWEFWEFQFCVLTEKSI